MLRAYTRSSPRSARRRLALAISGCFALAGVSGEAAAVLLVTSCADSGSGSLRDVVTNAPSGSTIDISSSLTCSRVTLTSGSITTTAQNITIEGTGQSTFTVDGNNHDNIFNSEHSGGAGTLTLRNMSITNGRQYGGGCVYVDGNLTLDHVTLSHCVSPGTANGGNIAGAVRTTYGDLTMTDSTITDSSTQFVGGGGGFINGNATLTRSTISNNSVQSLSTSLTNARGGGLYVRGNLSMTSSVISGNSLSNSATSGTTRGGGLYVGGDAHIEYSTIDGNHVTGPGTDVKGGGLFVSSHAGSVTVAYLHYSMVSGNSITSSTSGSLVQVQGGGVYSGKFTEIVHSTVDSNTSNGNGGGIAAAGHLNTRFSTIARNMAAFQGGAIYSSYHGTMTAINSTIGQNYTQNTGQCAGVFFGAGGMLTAESSIIARNTKYHNNSGCDIGLGTSQTLTISAANGHNLIQNSAATVPPDTINGDPQFFTLADNGGPTRTLGIPTTSPAYNTGSNIFSVQWDQRGPGFFRKSGGNPDIGAFESQRTGDGDTIFKNGFDPLIE